MSGTQLRSVLASYRDAVTEQLKAGAPFGDIEDSIDAVDDLTMDDGPTPRAPARYVLPAGALN
jgi:hypothetical protein